MDGVPGLSFHGIAPGASHLYRFPFVQQAGTHWYHCAFQPAGSAGACNGAIVIDPREPDGIAADREHVVLLSDQERRGIRMRSSASC